LNNTKECALKYGKHPPVLEGYIDANWIADFEESNQLENTSLLLEAQPYLENLPS